MWWAVHEDQTPLSPTGSFTLDQTDRRHNVSQDILTSASAFSPAKEVRGQAVGQYRPPSNPAPARQRPRCAGAMLTRPADRAGTDEA